MRFAKLKSTCFLLCILFSCNKDTPSIRKNLLSQPTKDFFSFGKKGSEWYFISKDGSKKDTIKCTSNSYTYTENKSNPDHFYYSDYVFIVIQNKERFYLLDIAPDDKGSMTIIRTWDYGTPTGNLFQASDLRTNSCICTTTEGFNSYYTSDTLRIVEGQQYDTLWIVKGVGPVAFTKENIHYDLTNYLIIP